MCGLSTRPGPFVSASSPGGEQQRHVNPAEKGKRNDEKGMSSIPERRTSTTSGNSSQNTLSLRLKARLCADSCLFWKTGRRGRNVFHMSAGRALWSRLVLTV